MSLPLLWLQTDIIKSGSSNCLFPRVQCDMDYELLSDKHSMRHYHMILILRDNFGCVKTGSVRQKDILRNF